MGPFCLLLWWVGLAGCLSLSAVSSGSSVVRAGAVPERELLLEVRIYVPVPAGGWDPILVDTRPATLQAFDCKRGQALQVRATVSRRMTGFGRCCRRKRKLRSRLSPNTSIATHLVFGPSLVVFCPSLHAPW
jgi:hypothetical protein